MPKTTTKKAPAKPLGRPKGDTPPPPVTGVRIPIELLAALDALAAKRTEALAPQGGSVSRNALIVAMLRDGVAREGGAP